jgi:hypothetical protein
MHGNFRARLAGQTINGLTIISLKIIYLTVIGSTFSEKEMLNEWKKHYTEKHLH